MTASPVWSAESGDYAVEHPANMISDYIADTKITANVKAAILQDSRITVNSLTVTTDQGKVTVSGFVTSASQIKHVRRLVNNTPGVKSFSNKLRLSQPKQSSLRTYASDTATTSEILARLYTMSDVDSRAIHVATRHGDVFLTGSLPSRAQKQQIEHMVKAISGVHHVKNELVIKPEH